MMLEIHSMKNGSPIFPIGSGEHSRGHIERDGTSNSDGSKPRCNSFLSNRI
jgi:hypothetical protein